MIYCHRCGNQVDPKWKFCPKCGAPVKVRPQPEAEPRMIRTKPLGGLFSFDNLFEDIARHMTDMEKRMRVDFGDMERDIKFFDLDKLKDAPKTKKSGFSISIRTGTGHEPKIDVKTFGDMDKKKLDKVVEKEFGVKAPKAKPRPMPKTTEEPQIDVKNLPNKMAISVKLPGVKDEQDISLTEYSESIELRAFAKDKLYFRILKVPSEWSIRTKKFTKGVLKIEMGP